jgi:hypothetical protein
MGFESTLAVLVAVFCGFGVARGAGMEALRHHMRALQLLSEESGLRPDVQMSAADTLVGSESNSGLLWPTVKHDQDVSTRSFCLSRSSRIW